MDTDVLVVGGGPTGLTLAGELAARGVACRIVDREPARRSESRALVVQPRTLELLDKWSGADTIAARGYRDVGVEIFVHGQKRVEIDFHDVGATHTRYPYVVFISQVETERVLDERLESLGVKVERPLELSGLVQDADGATATFADGRSLRARWVVGCDGAHSAVRKLADLAFPGAPYDQEFLLADVRREPAPRGLQFYLSDHGLLVVFPLGEGKLRFIASRARPAADTGPLTVGEMETALGELMPAPGPIGEPIWLTRFHLHHRGVDHYRRGRLFVAGDAAHIHSPAGGQGMNTGIQDAFNLAWKLALVAKGRAPEELLDSYEEERLPVGKRLLRTTDRLFTLGASRNRAVMMLRNFLFPRLARAFLRTPAARRRGFRFISQLAISYPGSSIVGEAAGLSDGPAPGDRMPDLPLSGGATLHEKLRGPNFHLLVVTRSGGALPRIADDLVEPHLVTGAPAELYEELGVDERALYLVRPDGHVAYRSPRADATAIDEALRTTLLTSLSPRSSPPHR